MLDCRVDSKHWVDIVRLRPFMGPENAEEMSEATGLDFFSFLEIPIDEDTLFRDMHSRKTGRAGISRIILYIAWPGVT